MIARPVPNGVTYAEEELWQEWLLVIQTITPSRAHLRRCVVRGWPVVLLYTVSNAALIPMVLPFAIRRGEHERAQARRG